MIENNHEPVLFQGQSPSAETLLTDHRTIANGKDVFAENL